jgi:hypothetical protein
LQRRQRIFDARVLGVTAAGRRSSWRRAAIAVVEPTAMNISSLALRIALLFPIAALVVLGHHALAQQLAPLLAQPAVPAPIRLAQWALPFAAAALVAWWLLPRAACLLRPHVPAEVVQAAGYAALAVVCARTAIETTASMSLHAPWGLVAFAIAVIAGLPGPELPSQRVRALAPVVGPLPPLRQSASLRRAA